MKGRCPCYLRPLQLQQRLATGLMLLMQAFRAVLRVQVPNGDLTADQLTYFGDCIGPYGEKGCADITTRANAQLRGLTLAEADHIAQGLVERGLSRSACTQWKHACKHSTDSQHVHMQHGGLLRFTADALRTVSATSSSARCPCCTNGTPGPQ